MKKRITNWSIGFLIFVIVAFIGIKWMAPYAVIQPFRRSENITPKDLSLEAKPLSIAVSDTISLSGYWIDSAIPETYGIIIMVHGIGGCKEHFLGLSKKLANLGYATIIFDGRAHGKSGGMYCSYGYYEKNDVSKIVDYIKEKAPELPIGIWGNSLGGAIAIQALEQDFRIEFGIIESTFTELDQIVYDYMERVSYGLGNRWVSDYILEQAAEIAQFNPYKVKPIESVQHIHQPILLAHGDADPNISVEYGKQLFANLASEEKELAIIKGAGHYNLLGKGGQAYANKVISFIYRNTKH